MSGHCCTGAYMVHGGVCVLLVLRLKIFYNVLRWVTIIFNAISTLE